MFDPAPGESIVINGATFHFLEIPNAPGIVYAEIGRKAKVYRLTREDGPDFALKVFKPVYRRSSVKVICELIRRYKDLPGMDTANRSVLTTASSLELIKTHPEFEYAVLMPWVNKMSCMDLFVNRQIMNKGALVEVVRKLSESLTELERHGLAHTDISSSNVLIEGNMPSVSLVGLEHMYGIDFPMPRPILSGSGGYAHANLDKFGQWCPEGDRFAGAILMCELLTWYDPRIRDASSSEHYFDQAEIGQQTKRLELMGSTLQEIRPSLSKLFLTAWFSRDLRSCPSLKTWNDEILGL